MTSISNVDESKASARMANLTLSGNGNENCQQTGNQLSQQTGNSSSSPHGNDVSRLPDNSAEPVSPRTLDVIDEDHMSGDEAAEPSSSQQQQQQQQQQQHRAKRANMVKKALTYFSDKSNRSVSEDNLFTRRKNLAVHLGLDNKVGIREVQKINTYCLPVPANNFDGGAPETSSGAGEMEVVSEDVKVKDLVRFLGIKDGMTASMASQGTLSDEMSQDGTQLLPPLAPHRRSKSFELQAKMLERSMTTEVDGTKHKDKKDNGKQKKY